MYHDSTFDNSKWNVYIFNTVFLIITVTKYESQPQGCHQIYRNTQKKTSIWEHSCTNYQVQYGFILPVGSIFTSVSEIIWWPSLKFNEWQKSVSYFSSNWNMFSKIIFDGFFRVQEILAELQFSFVCFLVGQHYDSFEQWKKLLIMLCTCEDAILEHSQLYMNLISELYFQVII